MSYFVSYPNKINGYEVHVVLGLQKNVLDSHYSLRRSKVALHECRDVPVATSLIYATVTEFLAARAEELLKPDAGVTMASTGADEIMRRAGNDVMTGVVWRIDQNCISGMWELFQSCNTISSQYYERSIGIGSIYLGRREHPSLKPIVTFAKPPQLNDYRSARKILQLASKGMPLHSDSEQVYGLCSLDVLREEDEDLFEVKILGHYDWELRHAGKALMRVKYGVPHLPKPPFDETKLRLDLPRIFPKVTPDAVSKIVRLVREAAKESHGTMLVIAEHAAEEAIRLKTESIPVQPCDLTPELIRHLTPIDGAVIVDTEAKCHAIGVILDGLANDRGDPGRGARYNSAILYVPSAFEGRFAIVISEDHGVDFVPKLRPRVRRSEIERVIRELESIASAPKIVRGKYASLFDWCEEHRFYMTQSDCFAINALVPKIESRLEREDPSAVRFVRQPFSVDPDMDESFYYEK